MFFVANGRRFWIVWSWVRLNMDIWKGALLWSVALSRSIVSCCFSYVCSVSLFPHNLVYIYTLYCLFCHFGMGFEMFFFWMTGSVWWSLFLAWLCSGGVHDRSPLKGNHSSKGKPMSHSLLRFGLVCIPPGYSSTQRGPTWSPKAMVALSLLPIFVGVVTFMSVMIWVVPRLGDSGTATFLLRLVLVAVSFFEGFSHSVLVMSMLLFVLFCS